MWSSRRGVEASFQAYYHWHFLLPFVFLPPLPPPLQRTLRGVFRGRRATDLDHQHAGGGRREGESAGRRLSLTLAGGKWLRVSMSVSVSTLTFLLQLVFSFSAWKPGATRGR